MMYHHIEYIQPKIHEYRCTETAKKINSGKWLCKEMLLLIFKYCEYEYAQVPQIALDVSFVV